MKSLTTIEQLNNLLNETEPFYVFKHSTRCNISEGALHEIETVEKEMGVQVPTIYYLDLLTYRPVSDYIEFTLKITHQSPQLILIENGKPTWSKTHWHITQKSILESLKNKTN